MSGSPARRRRRALGRIRDKIRGADALEAFDRMAVGVGAAEPPSGPGWGALALRGPFPPDWPEGMVAR